jgi:hypothetical protein
MQSRVTAAVIASCLLCAWGALEAYQWEKVYQAANHDPYSLRGQEIRLAGVPAVVPADAVMGFVSDLETGSNAEAAAFASARYMLTPRLLMHDAHRAWVLGILSKETDVPSIASANGLTFLQTFGNGAVLFRRASAR